jgi:sugar/nucleoside kinase (ribokinase family)
LLSYKKENPKTIWCSNPNKQDLLFLRNNLSILKYIDCFFLNLEEASILSNLPYTKEKEIFKFIDKYVHGICIVSKGSKGLTASDGQTIYHCGVHKHIKLIDTTGAGDALSSGFALMYQKTKDIEYSLKFALANAGNCIEKIGGNTNLLTPTIFNNRTWKKHFNKLKIKKEKI